MIGQILIDSCEVSATIAGNSAMIGTGETDGDATATIDAIHVSDSMLTLLGGGYGYGAMIGTGMSSGTSKQTAGVISVRSSTVDDARDLGCSDPDCLIASGVGCGDADGESEQRIDQIVCADSQLNGVLVGFGVADGMTRQTAGVITVAGCYLTSGQRGAGIGAYQGYDGSFTEIRHINVSSCEFRAAQPRGCCVGATGVTDSILTISEISVDNSHFTGSDTEGTLGNLDGLVFVGVAVIDGASNLTIQSIECAGCSFDCDTLMGCIGLAFQTDHSFANVTRIVARDCNFSVGASTLGVGTGTTAGWADQIVGEVVVAYCWGTIRIDAAFAPAIGFASGVSKSSQVCRTRFGQVIVRECSLTLSTWVGAGIGLGGFLGRDIPGDCALEFHQIIVEDSALSIECVLGAGIGTGYATSNVQIRGDRVSVRNCTGYIGGFDGAGIGIGFCDGKAGQVVTEILVTGCDIWIITGAAACIGSGASELLACDGGIVHSFMSSLLIHSRRCSFIRCRITSRECDTPTWSCPP
jgi:hypothetical protein